VRIGGVVSGSHVSPFCDEHDAAMPGPHARNSTPRLWACELISKTFEPFGIVMVLQYSRLSKGGTFCTKMLRESKMPWP